MISVTSQLKTWVPNSRRYPFKPNIMLFPISYYHKHFKIRNILFVRNFFFVVRDISKLVVVRDIFKLFAVSNFEINNRFFSISEVCMQSVSLRGVGVFKKRIVMSSLRCPDPGKIKNITKNCEKILNRKQDDHFVT